jgi:hypothetical protein
MSFGYNGSEVSGITKDLSVYAGGNLRFDLRAPAGTHIYVKLASSGAPDDCSSGAPFCEEISIDNMVIFDGLFHSISIPLSTFTSGGLDLSQFETLAITAKPVDAAFSFYVDNIRLER